MSEYPNNTPAGDAPWKNKLPPSGKRVLRRLLPWFGVGLLVIAVIWGLWPKPIVVEMAEVTKQALTVRVSEEGKTRVRNRYVVAAPVAGTLQRVTLKAGDAVQAGKTVIAKIKPIAAPLLDPRARAQAQAALAMSEARRKQVAESLTATQLALKLAESERERMRSVTGVGSLSKSAIDQIESEASIKAAELRATEFSLQVIDYEIAQARAVLEPPFDLGVENLMEVKSPVSGAVLHVLQESEMVVSPGMPVLEVGDPADLEIEAEILSRDAVTIQMGDAVVVEQWGGDVSLQGRVRRIEPAAFTKISALGVEEQRVLVLIDLVDPPVEAKSLGDRYRVEVRVAVWHADEVLAVPSGALFREGNDWKTYLYQGGKAVLTSLEAGHSDGRFTEVISGLEAGDAVLLHPPDTVVNGTSVKLR